MSSRQAWLHGLLAFVSLYYALITLGVQSSMVLLFIIPAGIYLAFKTATYVPKLNYARRLNDWVDRILNYVTLLDLVDQKIEEVQEKLANREGIGFPIHYTLPKRLPSVESMTEASRFLHTLAFLLNRDKLRKRDEELVALCEKLAWNHLPWLQCRFAPLLDKGQVSLLDPFFLCGQMSDGEMNPRVLAEYRSHRRAAQNDIDKLQGLYGEWYTAVARGLSPFGRFWMGGIPDLEFNPPPQKYLQEK